MREDQPNPLLYLVVCAAPPARHIDELVELLHHAGWRICVIPTPRAASWVDCQVLAERTGYPIRHDHQLPGDPESLPQASTIAVVPATFN
ncbi:MAG: flavoprotein, partial [Pseudonocardiaceae bacterium]